MMLHRRALWGLAAAGLAVRRADGQEMAFPRQQVRIVAPFAAGGSSDLVARIMAQQMQIATGKPFVVENLPGGNGVVGCVAKFAASRSWPRQASDQAATWNSLATKVAWVRMLRPPTPRTCPFLIIAIVS